MNVKRNIFSVLIFIWIVLAAFSIVYNIGKSVSEVREWGSLSDRQKRQKLFGDLYDFFIITNENTPKDATMLFYSKERFEYYIGRYYVYPRKIIIIDNRNTFITRASEKKFPFLLLYNNDIQIDGYEKVASFSSHTSKIFGYIYSKK